MRGVPGGVPGPVCRAVRPRRYSLRAAVSCTMTRMSIGSLGALCPGCGQPAGGCLSMCPALWFGQAPQPSQPDPGPEQADGAI